MVKALSVCTCHKPQLRFENLLPPWSPFSNLPESSGSPIILFFKIHFIDYAITVVPFPPLHSPPSCTPPPTHIPPLWFMSMGHTYKFFGFYISYTILTLTLFSTYHLCYLFSVPFPPVSPSHCPFDNPPCDLHFCGSVPVLVVCLVCFSFLF